MERTVEVYACLPGLAPSLAPLFSPTLSPFCLPQAWDLPSSIMMCPDSNLETDFGGKKEQTALLRSSKKAPKEETAIWAAPRLRNSRGGGEGKRGFQVPKPSDMGGASLHNRAPTRWVAESQMRQTASQGGQLSALRRQDACGYSHGSPGGNEVRLTGPWLFFVPTPCHLPIRTCRGGLGHPLQCSCLENPIDRSLAGCSP